MKNLYLIEYGCSICSEHLVVLADSLEDANEYAYLEAQNIYYSYDYNYPDAEDCEGMDEDDIAEMMQEDMEQDIHYLAVIYNPEDEEHVMVMHDQNDKPHEI
jgi:hypothetical protein